MPDFIAFAYPFLLVLCRTGAAIMLLPGFGEDDIPVLLKLGIAGALAILITPLVAPHLPPLPPDLLPLAGAITAELAAGALLGFMARLLALALPIAGQLISLMTGLSSLLQPDPTLGAETAVLGRLFSLLAPVLILASGLYALPLQALARSYETLPAGGTLAAGDLARLATENIGACFALALRLAAPFLLAGTLWQIGLGLLGRLVPQLQLYFAALPGQVLGGLLALSLLATTLATTWLSAISAGP